MDRINLIRCIAVWMVFALHVSLFNGENFYSGELFQEYPTAFIFKTPAWAGVWVFFIISGYLNSKNFIDLNFSINLHSIYNFYKKRLLKVFIPTAVFIFFCCVFIYPEFILNDKYIIFDFITLTYNGNPGVAGIGATWFVFTIMWLYILTPLLVTFLKYINKSYYLLVILTGLGCGLIYRYIAYHNNFDWYNMVYTPFWANIDLYLTGLVIGFYKNFNKIIYASKKVNNIILAVFFCL